MGSRSHSENEGGEEDYGELCDKFLEKLSEQPEYEEIVSEIGGALSSSCINLSY